MVNDRVCRVLFSHSQHGINQRVEGAQKGYNLLLESNIGGRGMAITFIPTTPTTRERVSICLLQSVSNSG